MRFPTPPIVKNLIVINILFFMAQTMLPDGRGEALTQALGLHVWGSEDFRLYQIVTHIFLHGSLTHLFSNMFALWMFGRILEYEIGNRRFLTYYMITGIGAALIHMGVVAWESAGLKDAALALINTPTPELFSSFLKDFMPTRLYESNIDFINSWMEYPDSTVYIEQVRSFAQNALANSLNTLTVGASGAVFGVLLAFGMMHPNDRIMLLIPPIPMKAKYFVIAYGAMELYLGVSGTESGIAHFAHIGGMIFGYILLRYWKSSGKIYY